MDRVKLEDGFSNKKSILLEADDELQDETGLQVDSSLITPDLCFCFKLLYQYQRLFT